MGKSLTGQVFDCWNKSDEWLLPSISDCVYPLGRDGGQSVQVCFLCVQLNKCNNCLHLALQKIYSDCRVCGVKKRILMFWVLCLGWARICEENYFPKLAPDAQFSWHPSAAEACLLAVGCRHWQPNGGVISEGMLCFWGCVSQPCGGSVAQAGALHWNWAWEK